METKGNVVVEEIKVGDILYEFDYGFYVKTEVLTKPVRDEDGYWTWQAMNTKTGDIINYGVAENYSHYGPNLYDYMAYEGTKEL